jgi:hypothetical protein
VLDAGCGTGEHTLMAAGLGLDATGVDLAARALRAAGQKARDRGLTARFLRQDALRRHDLRESFGTVLDCGLFHIFGGDRAATLPAAIGAAAGRPLFPAVLQRRPAPGLGTGAPGEHGRDHRRVRGGVADRLGRAGHDRHHRRSRRHPGLAGRPHQDLARAPGAGQTRRRPTMLAAEALVQTEHPARYLAQLCKHASKMGGHLRHRPRGRYGGGPPEIRHAQWSETDGIVTLNWGRWTMQATPGTLRLRAEAGSEEYLRRIQDLLTARLEKIGRRDRLTVTWQPGETPAAPGEAG